MNGVMSDVKEEERKKSKWRIIYAEVRVHSCCRGWASHEGTCCVACCACGTRKEVKAGTRHHCTTPTN